MSRDSAHLLTLTLGVALAVTGPVASANGLKGAARPNIVIFYIDDMHYNVPGCYGGQFAPTPHIDEIARSGVRFTTGYVSAPTCSPSRVGLLTGRYQQRSGHDFNTAGPGTELDLREMTLGDRLAKAGYQTALIGKWHLGSTTSDYLPGSRGFQTAYGSLENVKGGYFYRGSGPAETPREAPLTSGLYAREACRFIDENSGSPFLLYLAFNALHIRFEAAEATLQRFSGIENPRLRRFAAALTECDEAIGAVMARLRSLNLEENTLVFCLSDNGSPNGFENCVLRGGKGDLFEGGIRVPFMVQWKGRIPGGRVIEQPVIQLDVAPTVIAAAGVDVAGTPPFDGLNLLPLLTEAKAKVEHEVLYWRCGERYAVRQGDWKLVKAHKSSAPSLFHLATDEGETTDLSGAEPERVDQLRRLYEQWNSQMRPHRWVDARWDGEPKATVSFRLPAAVAAGLTAMLLILFRRRTEGRP